MNNPFFLLEDSDQRLIAVGETDSFNGRLKDCQSFIDKHAGEYVFVAMSYDLKNEIEQLSSNHESLVDFPGLYLFVPENIVSIKDGKKEVLKGGYTREIEELLENVNGSRGRSKKTEIKLQPRIKKSEYLNTIKHLQDHIQRGDIYEVTFCQDFYNNSVEIDPFGTYSRLNKLTKAPFSSLVRINGNYLISGSPERFLKKEGARLISQPIKGTARRGVDKEQDKKRKEELLQSEKERAENVMIVDLVRNDLSKIAKRNSVHVEELFGVYTFKTVHQLISTISAEIDTDMKFSEIVEALFPMGSMTGAPKISAMKLIEKYESFKRGLFSGSIGYIEPNGDFDLNVVIRSILYNDQKKTVSCPVGGAITIKSNPEAEYEECLLKGEAMQKALTS